MTFDIIKTRRQVHILLDVSRRQGAIYDWFDRFMVTLILLNMVAVMLETVDTLYNQYETYFHFFDILSVIIFTIEYIARIWSCIDHYSDKYASPITGRIRYFFTPLALIDLLAILPFYLSLLIPIDLRYIRIIRLLRILKIMRYFHALETLRVVVKRESNTLMAILILMFSILMFASASIYYLEKEIQPKDFASIPHAFWWAMSTLTTVGYGDVVPMTVVGKMLGILIMLTGIGMFALPAGILASAFAEETKRKDFLVTWNLVASVPLFSVLSAKEIASIVDCLEPHTAMPNDVIVHRDDEGHSMFFIIAGEVEVEIPDTPLRLKKGEYFGEIALLFECKRTATIIATSYVELLELDYENFQIILKTNHKLKERVTQEAERRLSEIQKT